MVFFNPAGPLTVNKIPYALGGGRLADSPMSNIGGNFYLGGDIIGSPTNSFDLGAAAFLWRRLYVGSYALFGTGTDQGNGRIQLASHSTDTSGIGFGTAAGSLYKYGAATFALTAPSATNGYGDLRVSKLLEPTSGLTMVNGEKLPNGWALPTGPQDRTTFDSASVNVGNLAIRVAALIHDLHRSGTLAATGYGHGLLTA